MARKLLSLATLVILAFGLLSSCDQLPGVEAAAIIGSIFIAPDTVAISGGAEFHVLICAGNANANPYTLGSIDAITPVARIDGTFPGTTSDWMWTTNYTITDVPAGTYYALVWIDQDDSGDFDGSLGDFYGIYDANAAGDAIWTQPSSPNVVVPTTGILDIDIWCGYQPPPS
jgi:hypothetical protein